MTEEYKTETEEEFHFVIKVVRLNTGVDIIAVCRTDEEAGNLILDSPMEIVLDRSDDAEQSIFLRPWLPIEIMDYAICMIEPEDILTTFYVEDDFDDYYFGLAQRMHKLMEENNEKFDDDSEEEEENSDIALPTTTVDLAAFEKLEAPKNKKKFN